MTYPESDLLREFETRTLDPSTFSHRRHLEVAFEMLRKYPFLEAVTRYSENIDAIATAAGASQKFNLTITLAFLSLIAERMKTAAHTDFETFLTINEDLLDTGLMNRWYSRPRLQQDHARTHFLMPDLTG
ncbi:MAG: hypothetical protein NXI13_05310 [Proteobacteria bacterium]|nr:hypothetical protein [Pseudomonadota bacterium]